jgi:signal transduction histidine kinase
VDAVLSTFGALLRIAQIESGARRAGFKDIDLSDIFIDIADAYGAVAEENGQMLQVAVKPQISTRGDRDLLSQMLANLGKH